MDTFARNALRFTLAGAGLVVLGAGYVGQASAAPAPVPDQGGTALQAVPTPQDAPATGNVQHVPTPNGQDIAKVATDQAAVQQQD